MVMLQLRVWIWQSRVCLGTTRIARVRTSVMAIDGSPRRVTVLRMAHVAGLACSVFPTHLALPAATKRNYIQAAALGMIQVATEKKREGEGERVTLWKGRVIALGVENRADVSSRTHPWQPTFCSMHFCTHAGCVSSGRRGCPLASVSITTTMIHPCSRRIAARCAVAANTTALRGCRSTVVSVDAGSLKIAASCCRPSVVLSVRQ